MPIITMYKSIKLSKFRIAINKFPITAKNIPTKSKAYFTGIRSWKADDSYNTSLVIWTFRIIFSIKRKQYSCCSN